MEFLIYIEIGLALLTIAIVVFVLRLAKRDKAASLNRSSNKNSQR